MSGLIDIGANLLHTQFEADRMEVLTRARSAGVDRVIITATNLQVAAGITAFLDAHRERMDWPRLHSTVGIHPHDAANAEPEWELTLARLARHPAVVAIGETGLDFHRNFSPPERQREVFASQIDIANATGRPLFVHDRDSHGEVLTLLRERETPPENVVIHCFTGTAEELDTYLEAGYCIGITGWVCDTRRGHSLRDLVQRIPLSRLLIETDAPFLLPHDLPKDLAHSPRGRRNEPAYLPHIAKTLAGLLRVQLEALTQATTTNAVRLFRLPDEVIDVPARP